MRRLFGSGQLRASMPLLLSVGGVLLLHVALLATLLQPLNGFWAGDQGVKLIQIQNLLIQRFRTTALVYPGAQFDPERLASPLRIQYYTHNSQTFAMFSDAFAAASAVPFFMFGYPGLYLLPVLSTALTLLLIGLLARRLLPAGATIPAILIGAFATPIGLYALLFWEHAPATALVTLALWLVVQADSLPNKSWPLAFAGALIAIAGWLRIEALIALPAFAAALLISQPQQAIRRILLLGVGAVIGLLPFLIYNQLVFGYALGPHVLAHLSPNVADASVGAAAPARLLTGRSEWLANNLLPTDPVLFGTCMVGTLIAALLGRWWPQLGRWLILGCALGACLLADGYRSRLPSTTLLMTMPLVLLAMLPLPQSQQRSALGLIRAFGGMFVLGCLLAPLPDGGAQWGPRMLLPALPALLIAALGGVAGALTRRGPQQIAAIAALTLAISAGGFSQGTGILKIRESNRNVVALTTAVVQSKAQVIISDTVSAPALLAQIFYTGPQIYWTDTPASFDTLITTLARAHTTDFYYISASQQNQADAQRWRDLIPIGQPERLPYGWSGQRYQIVGP